MNFKGTTEDEIINYIRDECILPSDIEFIKVLFIQDLAEARQLLEEKKALVEVQYMKLKEQREKIGELLKINEELRK